MLYPARDHAALRAFVAVFRAVRGFSRTSAAGFLALGAALTTDGNSSLGCFAVRWWHGVEAGCGQLLRPSATERFYLFGALVQGTPESF
jgi:hypothetical protein